MTAPRYHHRVEQDGPDVTRNLLYDGPDAADAMAAWSAAVSEGNMYVTLESLIAAGPLPGTAEAEIRESLWLRNPHEQDPLEALHTIDTEGL